MSRVVRTQNLGTQRTRLSKSVVLAIREILKKQVFDAEVKEMISYIVIALIAINETVDAAIEPWEKRGYWLKADRFRLDWEWVTVLSVKLKVEFNKNNLEDVIPILIEIGLKFNSIQVSERHRMGKPWIGASEEYELRELHLDD